MPKRCAFHVLGCKVNQNEAEALKNIFTKEGYKIVPFHEKADVYVVHTCTVTSTSDKKSRQFIRRAVKNNPQAVIAVTGCYSQVSPEEAGNIPGVNIVIGTNERGRLPELVEEAKKTKNIIKAVDNSSSYKKFETLPLVTTDRVRAFLKIQDGCESFCAYCIVPYARGPVRSHDFESVVSEAKRLIKKGYKEIVLTGIHTGFYGRDFSDEKTDLVSLIKEITQFDGLERIRVSSLNPEDFTDKLLEELTSNPIVCPHYHIPLQSGDNLILSKMGRRYTVEEYRTLLEKIRIKRPEAAVTTDVMVGFPGESWKNYRNTYDFVEKIAFSDVHVFQYSLRKGTSAYEMEGHVSSDEKKKRSRELNSLADQLFVNYAAKFLGRVTRVLVEKNIEESIWEGHTDNYLPVVFRSNKSSLQGVLADVYLEDIVNRKTHGTLIKIGR